MGDMNNNKMAVNVCWTGGATVIIDIDNKIKIASDPALSRKDKEIEFKTFKSKRIKSPVYDDIDFNNVDLWLLTHGHLDHLDEDGKKAISIDTKVICSESVLKIIEDPSYINKIILGWNEEYSININGYDIKIKAIPAVHSNIFFVALFMGRQNGYYVEVKKDNETVSFYFTGDTTFNKVVLRSLKNKKIDYMFSNLGNVMSNKFGGPITMSMDMLNNFNESLKPKKIIPLHYDDYSHFEMKEQDVIDAGYSVLKRGEWTNI